MCSLYGISLGHIYGTCICNVDASEQYRMDINPSSLAIWQLIGILIAIRYLQSSFHIVLACGLFTEMIDKISLSD